MREEKQNRRDPKHEKTARKEESGKKESQKRMEEYARVYKLHRFLLHDQQNMTKPFNVYDEKGRKSIAKEKEI